MKHGSITHDELFSTVDLALLGIFFVETRNGEIQWSNQYCCKSLGLRPGENFFAEIENAKNISLTHIREVRFIWNNESYLCFVFPFTHLMSLVIISPHSQLAQDKGRVTIPNSKKAFSLDDIVFSSSTMSNTIAKLVRAASVDTNVLIVGETGVGKTSLCKILHALSPRKEAPFISINCSAIPPTLLEAELFGYEKGSFTGADRAGRPGFLETGHTGTILLDEIGDLPLSVQAKLLHVIEDKTIYRVGGRKPITLDIRIVAATNTNLEKMALNGDFRQDLYYRLSVVTINVPPLRERLDEIPDLVIRFLEKINQKYNLRKTISNDIISLLQNYPWPGNVRELQNVVEQVAIMAESDIIKATDLPAYIMTPIIPNTTQAIKPIVETKSQLGIQKNDLERDLITQMLRESPSVRETARKLGISHSTLLRKAKKLGIDWHLFC